MYLGHYPQEGLAAFGKDSPDIHPGDMATIHQPLDFFSVNIYQGWATRAGDEGTPEFVPLPEGHAKTGNHWPVVPEVLYWGPRFFYERYHLPIYITENGLSGIDWVALDGKVHDSQRIDYTRRYLLALRRASQEGVAVGGYFHWSLMDNFEWAEGFKERFGLVYVDFSTQKRIPKDSAHWYQQVMTTNGAFLDQNPS